MTTHLCTGPDVPLVLADVDRAVGAGLRPTLALAFCSPHQDVAGLAAGLAERGLDVVGATTAGEVADGAILEGTCAVMLWQAAPGSYAVWSGGRPADEPAEAVAARLGRAAAEAFARPVVFAFASGVRTDGEAVVRGVERGAGRPLPLYGGLAGDDLRMAETTVFSAHDAFDDGLVALVLDGDRYRVEGVATSGWQAVGVEKAVTRSEGNVVFELDGRPILDVYSEYLAMGDLRAEGVHVAMDLGVQYPLSVRRADGTAVLRAPLLSDPETDALVFAGAVPKGARVRFCVPPSLDVAERVVEEAAAVRERLPDADAVLLVSCVARHMALGPLMEDEVEGLSGLWDAPPPRLLLLRRDRRRRRRPDRPPQRDVLARRRPGAADRPCIARSSRSSPTSSPPTSPTPTRRPRPGTWSGPPTASWPGASSGPGTWAVRTGR